MDLTTLDLQQARIKQILFKSQLRSVLYGVRKADEALFSPQGNALGQWLSTQVKPRYPGHPAMREAEGLFQQLPQHGPRTGHPVPPGAYRRSPPGPHPHRPSR